jgi:hypothetical protein
MYTPGHKDVIITHTVTDDEVEFQLALIGMARRSR